MPAAGYAYAPNGTIFVTNHEVGKIVRISPDGNQQIHATKIPISKLGTANAELGTANVKPGAANVKPGAINVKPGATNVKPGTTNVKPGTTNV